MTIFNTKIWWPFSLLTLALSLYFLFSLRSEYSDYGVKRHNKYILKFSLNGLLLKNSYYIGIFIVIVSLLSEYLFFDKKISVNSLISISVGFVWLLYNFVPKKFWYERDFAFLYIHFLFILLVLPRLIIFYVTDTAGQITPSPFENFLVHNFLGKPVYLVLNFFNYEVWLNANSIFYIDTTKNLSTSVIISSGCSGMYSVMIFMCAFFSYGLMLENIPFSRISFFFLLGIFTSYISNLIRMITIILVGHYEGPEALDFAHQNLGWIIFVLWMWIFWYFLSKYITKDLKMEFR